MSFNQNVQDKLSNLTDKQVYWLFAGILIGIFVLDFLFIMSPQLGALSKINPEIKLLEENIKNANNDLARMDFYESEVKRLEDQRMEMKSRILHRQEMPLILEKISRIAEKNKITVDQIMPDVMSAETFLETPEKKYYLLPVLIEAQSTYHDFGRFINAIEKEKIYFSIERFTISGKPNSKKHDLMLTLGAVLYEEVVE